MNLGRFLFVMMFMVLMMLTNVVGRWSDQVPPQQANAFGTTPLKMGSKGKDVVELQGRLKALGFHKGNIDGQFGWGTYGALSNFQKAWVLKPTGVADSLSKVRLWEATKTYRPGVEEAQAMSTKSTKTIPVMNANTISASDLKLLTRIIYGEGRGEPYEGQVAIAAVILNRITNPLFPDTISGVIFQPGAFTAVTDRQIWMEPNDRAKQAALDALSGWDPSEQSLYYFNPKTATSKWIWSRPQVKKIGDHIFTK